MTTNKYAFHVNTAACSGCKTCHIACKDKNDSPVGVILRRVYEYAGGSYNRTDNGALTSNVFGYYMSIGCNHCDSPACTKACPTGAAHKKSNGIVDIDQSICIGCGACAEACPYDAPQFNTATQTMNKCNACYDRLLEGKNPSCVDACPMRALDFGTIEELNKKYPNSERGNIAPLPSSSITTPNLFVKHNVNARPIGSSDGKVLNSDEV
ncbi:DMSO/selenate family reductase complex B subunit [Shewanella sp. A14]